MPQEQLGAVQEELSAATETLFGSRSVIECGMTSQTHGSSHHTAKTSCHSPPKILSLCTHWLADSQRCHVCWPYWTHGNPES